MWQIFRLPINKKATANLCSAALADTLNACSFLQLPVQSSSVFLLLFSFLFLLSSLFSFLSCLSLLSLVPRLKQSMFLSDGIFVELGTTFTFSPSAGVSLSVHSSARFLLHTMTSADSLCSFEW